jgi:hypothetical protein
MSATRQRAPYRRRGASDDAAAEGKGDTLMGMEQKIARIPLTTFDDVMAVAEFAATLKGLDKLGLAVSLAQWLESHAEPASLSGVYKSEHPREDSEPT